MKSFSRISGHPVVGFATLQLENNLLVLNVLQKRGSASLFPVLNSVGFFCLMKDKTVEFQDCVWSLRMMKMLKKQVMYI